MREINLNEEINFENLKQINKNFRKNQDKFYWATDLDIKKHNKMTCKIIKDKKVLEIGCAQGEDAILYSNYFLTYIGLAISDKAIEKAKSLKLKNADFICTDSHKLPLESDSFECVIVNRVLHHLDLEEALKEISRVLTKDGCMIFWEPLGTNFLFQIYRKLTPLARTPDERPFQFKDLNLIKRYFTFTNVKYFGFLNIFSAFIRIEFVRKILTGIDNYISKTFLKFFFWQFSGVAKKK